jgi:GNAT superfamily N-acetyltransferase
MATVIEPFAPERRDAAVAVLADAFVRNPLLMAAFGAGRLDRSRSFFDIGLRQMFTGSAFVAIIDGAVRGYVHFVPSLSCLPPPDQLPAAAETLWRPLGDAAPRLLEWFSAWSRLDPKEPHLHLGPIGVSPAMQRQGVGKTLMARYIEHLDREALAGYLETDKPENVEFYRTFGFVVQHEESVIGTPTWYMWRSR